MPPVVASRSNDFIREMCTRALLVESGAKIADGAADEGLDHYEIRK